MAYGRKPPHGFLGVRRRGTSSLGSGELNLLAGDAHAISTAAADQPFYSDARLAVSQNLTDPRAKLQLLSGALSEFPARNDIRLAAFRTATALREDQLSVAVISPFLNPRFPVGAPEDPGAEENQGARKPTAAEIFQYLREYPPSIGRGLRQQSEKQWPGSTV